MLDIDVVKAVDEFAAKFKEVPTEQRIAFLTWLEELLKSKKIVITIEEKQ